MTKVAAIYRSYENFLLEEFTAIWLKMTEKNLNTWNTGRIRKIKISGRDALVMLFKVVEHGQQWNFMAKLFGMSGNTFERIMVEVLKAASAHMYQVCVQCVQE